MRYAAAEHALRLPDNRREAFALFALRVPGDVVEGFLREQQGRETASAAPGWFWQQSS